MSNCMGKRPKKMASGGKPKSTQVKSKMQQMYERESGLDTQEKLEQARKKARSMMPFAPKEKTRTDKENANEMRRHQGRADQAKANRKKSFPDLNKDGKVTQADILKGRGVGKAYGGKIKKMATGGKVKGRRGDGICSRGKTKGRMV